MNFKNILFKQESNVAVISINRPKVLNAINTYVLEEIETAIDNIMENDNINVLLITGNGKDFSAGADISEIINYSSEEGRMFTKKGQDILRKIEVFEKPVIAAISGFALGCGCELAMSCDIRIAEEGARFGHPEVDFGMIPGFGGTQRLTRLTGRGKAKQLIYTGEIINAKEAERIGLVEKVVSKENLMKEAMRMARKIASKGQIAIKYAKTVMTIGIETDIDIALQIERDAVGVCFASGEQKESMLRFLKSRESEIKGA
ncbi:enoyl-CoA hydratase-related protein [Clostridium sp. JNZ J1-5]